eukprot:TRINITY_DN1377_c0_g2_i2.p1 TRINITY_DN1377_c0_g2~~TRINITY_DN1377_c0_g2_i2.p1  ORF type:complete len:469 (+),score=116.77 TRINITY_DN1377_c0_g2_i2:50-1456(+)
MEDDSSVPRIDPSTISSPLFSSDNITEEASLPTSLSKEKKTPNKRKAEMKNAWLMKLQLEERERGWKKTFSPAKRTTSLTSSDDKLTSDHTSIFAATQRSAFFDRVLPSRPQSKPVSIDAPLDTIHRLQLDEEREQDIDSTKDESLVVVEPQQQQHDTVRSGQEQEQSNESQRNIKAIIKSKSNQNQENDQNFKRLLKGRWMDAIVQEEEKQRIQQEDEKWCAIVEKKKREKKAKRWANECKIHEKEWNAQRKIKQRMKEVLTLTPFDSSSNVASSSASSVLSSSVSSVLSSSSSSSSSFSSSNLPSSTISTSSSVASSSSSSSSFVASISDDLSRFSMTSRLQHRVAELESRTEQLATENERLKKEKNEAVTRYRNQNDELKRLNALVQSLHEKLTVCTHSTASTSLSHTSTPSFASSSTSAFLTQKSARRKPCSQPQPKTHLHAVNPKPNYLHSRNKPAFLIADDL